MFAGCVIYRCQITLVTAVTDVKWRFEFSMSQKFIIFCMLFLCSVMTHFAFFGTPREVVFDEVYFGKFVSSYDRGSEFFDIHPPLGKLLVFSVMRLCDLHLHTDFSQIGNLYEGNEQYILRFLPCVVGTLIPLIIFIIALKLNYSVHAATILSVLLIFENALVVQTRFFFLDGFMIFFGLLAILCYLSYRKCDRNIFLYTAVIFGTMAASVKWTGATFLFLIVIHYFFLHIKKKWKQIIKASLLFVAFPLIIYMSFFIIHAWIVACNVENYSSDQKQTCDLDSVMRNISWNNFTETNYSMYVASRDLEQEHPYSSKWYTWPFMIKPIYYWTDGHETNIYFIGNSVVWLFGLVSVPVAIFVIIRGRDMEDVTMHYLLAAYFINWLPFALIGRAMFLYHYLSSLIFSVMIGVYLLDKHDLLRKCDVVIVILVLCAAIALCPITYGVRFY